jgi:cyclohexyl-isocyanide hydratase
MKEKVRPFRIVIPIYHGVDLLDVAGPYEMFYWMGTLWKERTVTIELAAKTRRFIRTHDGLKLTPDRTFADYEKHRLKADLLWVPGGRPEDLQDVMKDKTYLAFLTSQSAGAAYVTSVCVGTMLLASAGLLDGYKATTHWAFLPCLKAFPAIKVARGNPRYVADRNRMTGGGVSAGLDEALELVARIAGSKIARQVQLDTQYFPRPPFTGKIPIAKACPIQISPNAKRKKS